MEGSGASIFSDGAELATRGMDSADEEPETSNVIETVEEPKLPSALQDILQRLEGKGEPLRRHPNFSAINVREFFPCRAPRSVTGWRSQVRLRVLEAIGNCNTFEVLEVREICDGDISSLTASEWEIVLRGFMSSTILQTIIIRSIAWAWGSDDMESFCLQLGRILNSSSVTELYIEDCRLSARCLLNLASGLRGNCESKLEKLHLQNAWWDSSAGKHVAEVINSAPLLQTLILQGDSQMDDEAVGMLSQALIKSSSLKQLELNSVKWGAALLLTALARDNGNLSIERLHLRGVDMDGRGDCLRQLLTSYLKELRLYWLQMRPEDWQQLGEVIRDKAIATTIYVEFPLGYDDNYEWKSIEALACATTSDVKDPTVELDLKIWSGLDGYELSLNLLGRVLRGEVKSVESLHIERHSRQWGDRFESINEDRLKSILSMNGNTGETSVLKRLGFSGHYKDVLKYLLPCLRGNTSLTHLDLRYSDLDDETFRDLMSLLQVNLTLQEIDVRKTSWDSAGKEAQIQEALKQNQKRAVYMSVFIEAKLAFGDAKAGRLFLCGSPLADLCFKVEDPSQYFIPSFLPEHASTEKQTPQALAWKNRDETTQFVGIRIQCQDEITMSLTAAFFPCFQIFMRRKLISEMNVSKKNVNFSRHYLQFFFDGYEIYVEQGTSHKYVDVLMLRSMHKSRSEALQYMMKYIVEELISFCASSKGCPGVALVLGVIQTHCVKMLVPSDLRGAILIDELKSNFIRRSNEKLERIPPDELHLVEWEKLLNYEHSWPSIDRHTPVISERAKDLLRESDVEAVVNEIRQKQMQQLESWQQSLIQQMESRQQRLIQQLESLQEGLKEVNKDLIHSYPENENMVTNSNFADVKDSNRSSSRCLSQESSSVEDPNTRLILESIYVVGNKVDRVEKKVDGVDERLRSVQSILQRLEMKILSLQQELQSTLSDFTSKVDRIVKYSHSFQKPLLPKQPYITDDVGVFHRMNAALNAGTTVRLHLMCESSTGFHKVKDQEGLKIRVDRYNSSWIGKTIEISYKIMYYAAKAGLDVTLGLGQAIPDLADLRSNIVKLVGISDSDRRAVLKGGESMELQEAWLRIQQTLAPELRDSYSANFKLYQVKYVSLELGGHAWVCEECMDKGFRSGILTY
ncbi:hypothetical protein AXG93_1037s1010 [Marchantia polymorpha subsp. ruderalis]|uniref:Uncharacterized protein n=1 Tax=Marchantia polymorpha subsp. ruderalis TaxID=1480154 RepID=A0A176WEB9_MARPO|nr:hypothetical protein AXG93_1037s1010 [Marchantia polymorpha subsp. ruderalis]